MVFKPRPRYGRFPRPARALGLVTPVLRSSELGTIRGAKSSMIVEIAKLVGADAFLSGDGATYLDQRVFKRSGIELVGQDFRHPVYRQLHMRQGFLARMSGLDLLLNEGPAGAELLLGDRHEEVGNATRLQPSADRR